MSDTDWIIVGGGSAGCVLAWRLAVQFGGRVTLVEPPSTAAPSIDRHRPARWINLLGSAEDWDFRTAANKSLAGRQLHWPRGRGLGGSSRINAMIWFPPTERDLLNLSAAGGANFSGDRLRDATRLVQDLVRPESPRWISPTTLSFIRAVSDFPDATPMIYQRVNRGGRRWNPDTLLDPCIATGSVQIVRGTVDRVLWQRDRAIGVRAISESTAGQHGTIDLTAARGVVLCAGSIATPTLLMRSGIGPRDQLAAHGIDVRHECAAVGSNLQDHLIMPVIFATSSDSVGKHKFSPHVSVRDLARWQCLGNGPLASNLAEAGGLFDHGRVQIHVTPTHYLTYPQPTDTTAMTIGVNLTQPSSRGQIRLAGRDPMLAPEIEANDFGDEADRTGLVQAVTLARRIARHTSLADDLTDELIPGARRSDESAIAKAIARYAQTLYHPAGTCRLGTNPQDVVDASFAVRGGERLWVADASVLPQLTVGNPNATVMTLAALAAEAMA